MRMMWPFFALLAIPAMLLFIALGGALVYLLWNWLLPPIFGWHALTFWQALGLLALCRILFGGLGLHRSPNWSSTGESRERLRQRFRERVRRHFGFGPDPGENPGQGTA